MKKILVCLLSAFVLSMGVFAAFERVNKYENNFSDVKSTSWYAENVKTAYELGFMNGKTADKFDPDGSVTVVEAITMASRLHAVYNGVDLQNYTKKVDEYRLDFDDEDFVTDLSERNSRAENVIFGHANGKIEDGCLVVKATEPNDRGSYDPQIKFIGLDFIARDYSKMTFRMRCDELPNLDPEKTRINSVQVFFTTYEDVNYDEKKSTLLYLNDVDVTQWFEAQIDFTSNEEWRDVLKDIRFDPPNNNGVYYIDYIVFSKSDSTEGEKWYDKYVDYAIENGIVEKDRYYTSDYGRNITRAELCDLFAAALPCEYYNPINNIKGIPDVQRDAINADVYLMLYNAGVLLGSDDKGTFNADSDIKRSEVAAIINRAALPEYRVKGTTDADWSKEGNEYDLEFNDENSINKVAVNKAEAYVKNGALVLTSLDMGEDAAVRYDPQISVKNVNINAEDFSKLKVRMKVEFVGEVTSTKFDFYFKTDEDSGLSEKKSVHQDFAEYSYIDPSGWYVMEVDLRFTNEWKGNITEFRFDPANTNGVYTIDYIRLADPDPFHGASHETLISNGFSAVRLLQDEGFERGFYVERSGKETVNFRERKFQDYCETNEAPLWKIAPLWSFNDVYNNRDTETDKYTLKDDKGIDTITYNPEEKSVTLRLDATKVHNGKPHYSNTTTWWPHLLVEQSGEYCEFDKERNSANADKMFVELDVRLLDYKDTINPEGDNTCSFLIYFYLMTDKAPGQRIWFGLDVLSGLAASTRTQAGWSPDSAAHQYMYKIPQAVVFGGIENSFNPQKNVAAVSDKWKHIRLDVTPHIERALEWANRDNAFGVKVSKQDMYFSGVNIGFEIWGNYDCTVEFKNFNMVSYNKD